MSTSSPDFNSLPNMDNGDDAAKAASSLNSGFAMPDVATLQRMANEFYQAMPGTQAPDFSGAIPQNTVPKQPAMPQTAAMPAEVGDVPGMQDFGLTTAPHFTLPQVPGFDVPDFTQASAMNADAPFYFLGGLGMPAMPKMPTAVPKTDNVAVKDKAPAANPPILNSKFTMPPVQDLSLDDFTRPPAGTGDAGLYFMDEAFRAAGVSLETRKAANKGGDELREAFKQAREDVDPKKQDGGVPKLNLPLAPFDVEAVRRDFPILNQRVHGKRLVWLDNGATSQKPQSVIDRISRFYETENSNIHRAAHTLAGRATDAYEAAREKTRKFLNARSAKEIVFVRGATEAINLVAKSWGRQRVGKDDEIVVTHLEHHANIVPWQMLCQAVGAKLKVAPVDDRGQVILSAYEQLMGPRTKLVAFTQVSNALGTVTPAAQMVEIAHRFGAKVLIDGAQSIQHMRTDVQALDCDWYVFSGHKVFAPTGIGVLFGKQEVLEAAPPWQGGGNMIADVTFDRTIYQPAPGRFEAGTGSIADAVGLGAAIDYLDSIGMENIARYEHELMDYLLKGLRTLPIRILGNPEERAGVVSFVSSSMRSEDIGVALDKDGIAVRAGHHCAQPILRRFGVESSVRPSIALYNTCEDIDALIASLRRILNIR
ncbi:MAG: cysteine desulfurase [Planctomycetes bacterium]|nr:cysteine desulfurase [Planctomycetota bacterium]